MADRSLLMHFDHAPRVIVAAMANLRTRRENVRRVLDGSGKVLASLILGGAAVIYLDRLYGYESHLFTLVGAGSILFGFWAWYRRDKAATQPEFDQPELAMARDVIYALRDDLAKKRNLHGTLDLRGSVDPRKRSHTKKDARGRTVSYYRDDWLHMKAKLYDGSMLRCAVIARLKIRDEYHKRGRVSGRMKLKPAVVKAAEQHIDVRVSANPHLYTLSAQAAPRVGQTVGGTTISQVTLEGGLLRVLASSPRHPSAEEVLDVLLLTYATLQRKDAA